MIIFVIIWINILTITILAITILTIATILTMVAITAMVAMWNAFFSRAAPWSLTLELRLCPGRKSFGRNCYGHEGVFLYYIDEIVDGDNDSKAQSWLWLWYNDDDKYNDIVNDIIDDNDNDVVKVDFIDDENDNDVVRYCRGLQL